MDLFGPKEMVPHLKQWISGKFQEKLQDWKATSYYIATETIIDLEHNTGFSFPQESRLHQKTEARNKYIMRREKKNNPNTVLRPNL
jgi:hypothetical protein